MVVEMVPLKGARWAPASYKWSYNPYKWPYNWVTGVITPISGVITLLITGRGAHLVGFGRIFYPPGSARTISGIIYVLGSKLTLFPYNRGWSSTQ